MSTNLLYLTKADSTYGSHSSYYTQLPLASFDHIHLSTIFSRSPTLTSRVVGKAYNKLFGIRNQNSSTDDMRSTCLDFKFNDQPGVNLLVLTSGIPVTNLTLIPPFLESSWAGDYPSYPHNYWDSAEKMPYLLHWAGLPIYKYRDID